MLPYQRCHSVFVSDSLRDCWHTVRTTGWFSVMKKFLAAIGVLTVLYFLWVGVSDYSLRDACGGLMWYTAHPSLIGDTCAFLTTVSPEEIWSGWACRIGDKVLYISHDVPTLALGILWGILGLCGLLWGG